MTTTTIYKALLHLQGAKGLGNLKELLGIVSEARLWGEEWNKQTTKITRGGDLTVRLRSGNNGGKSVGTWGHILQEPQGHQEDRSNRHPTSVVSQLPVVWLSTSRDGGFESYCAPHWTEWAWLSDSTSLSLCFSSVKGAKRNIHLLELSGLKESIRVIL